MSDEQPKEGKPDSTTPELAKVTGIVVEDPNYRAGAGTWATAIDGTISYLNLPTKSHAIVNFGQLLQSTLGSEQKVLDLDREINKLRSEYNDQTLELARFKTRTREVEELIAARDATLAKFQRKSDLAFLLDRVNAKAGLLLLSSPNFQDQFSPGNEHPTFVMSVDIRQSTSLMLKARTPQAFATFINGLCSYLMDVIKNNYGVVDKFTGDGVLAFFPEFYSGQDSGFYAVKAALECHDVFRRHYKSSRTSFTSVLTEVGLGIGIDYGQTHLLRMADGLTVVGQPVVYACRLGAAPRGKTYLNQPAYEKVCGRPNSAFLFAEETLDIKHEGSILAYSVAFSGNQAEPALPAWTHEVTSPGPESEQSRPTEN
jgi:class 3 adenylate cyclase